MEIKILTEKMPIAEVKEFAQTWYNELVKDTVDIEMEKVAIGGDYHIESCEVLARAGGRHENIWGFNVRFGETPTLEFDSMVNIKPAQNVRSQIITNDEIK